MKQKFLIALMMFLCVNLGGASEAWAQNKTSHSTAIVVDVDTTQDEIEAYSDTTNTVVATTPAADTDSARAKAWELILSHNAKNNEEMFDFLGALFGGLTGIIGVVIVLMVIFFFILLPILLLALLIRYVIKRHNESVTAAEQAVQSGQPMSSAFVSQEKPSGETLRNRGITHAAVGVGLALMFWMWDSNMLAGLGLLLMCYGIGQILIARTSEKKESAPADQVPPAENENNDQTE